MSTSNPGIGHNQPTTMSDDACKALALVAFNETDDAKKILGTAVQRMSAAEMAHHANMVANARDTDGKPVEITALAKACQPLEAMARANLQKAMVAFFIPGRIVTPVKTDRGKAATRDAQTNHVTLIRDGLDLASILALCNVGLDAFDKERGLWNVPASLLCSDGFRIDTDAPTILLDGTACVAVKRVAGGKPEYESFMASVKRLKDMRKPKLAREPASGQGGNAATAQAGGVTIRSKVADLMLNLRATDNGVPVYASWSKIEDADRNALTSLVKLVDALKAADAANAAPRKRAA